MREGGPCIAQGFLLTYWQERLREEWAWLPSWATWVILLSVRKTCRSTWQLGSGAGCFLFPDLSKGVSFPSLPQHNLYPSQQASESWVLGRNGSSFEAYLFLSRPPERPLYSTDLLTLRSTGTSHYFLSINKNKVLSGSVSKAFHASVRAWVQTPRVQ